MSEQKPLIVNYSHNKGKPGDFFSNHFGGRLRWRFVDADPAGSWLGRIRRPDLARIKGGLDTSWRAIRERAALVVSHGPGVTFACESFLRRLGFRGPHLAFSFNYPALPTGLRLRLMRSAFRTIDRFVVYSTVERQVYNATFGIPLDKIDFIHWGVRPPQPTPADRPLISGDYACAIGGNARDYATLFTAMRAVPQARLVVVARPQNLVGLTAPANVEVRADIPLGEAMNILAFSRFMVLPLAGSDVPCGHVTLVHALHLGKAFVISNSSGVADYVRPGENAITCEAFSPDAMADAIRLLWEDRTRCDDIGARGKAFAARHCTEAATLAWFTNYLRAKGLLRD